MYAENVTMSKGFKQFQHSVVPFTCHTEQEEIKSGKINLQLSAVLDDNWLGGFAAL